MTFPLKGSGEWALTADKLAEWQESFPGIDLDGELRKARQWLLDNAERRKTGRGMAKFLGGWLSRAKPAERSAADSAADAKRIMDEHTQRVLAEKRAALSAKREGRS